MNPAPIFHRRENMGASPLAVNSTENLVKLLEQEGIAIPRGQKILIAAHIDAAVRASGAPELYAAAKRAQPWIGKLIADGGHQNAVMPNDAVRAMEMLEAAVTHTERADV